MVNRAVQTPARGSECANLAADNAGPGRDCHDRPCSRECPCTIFQRVTTRDWLMTARKRATGRQRPRQSADRTAEFARTIPKKQKRSVGISTAADTPLHIRAPGLQLPPDIRDDVHARVSAKLGKFARAITRISVRFEDLAGTTGGTRIECRFKVLLRNAPDVLLAGQGASIDAALRSALSSAERTVRRTLEKKETTRRTGPGRP